MTSKLLTHTSKHSRSVYILPIAVLSTTFFVASAPAIAETPAATSLQAISTNASVASKAAPTIQSITPAPTADCPLNSGGPSLLGTTWRLESIYGNRIPQPLKIDMRISTHALSGFSGCNKYSASFNQVGYTGFKVKQITQTKKTCSVIIPYKTAQAINVGNWEGSYLRTLRRMGSVRQITNSKLHFFNRNGEIGLILTKIADENKPAPKKIIAPQAAPKPTIQKAAPTQQPQAMPQKTEDQAVIRKISTNEDDALAKFFKSLGF
jgi:heat shock protein HslJ